MSYSPEIIIENISKKFCANLKKSLWYGVRDIWGELNNRRSESVVLRDSEFWANKDISLDIRQGDTFGLIGSNGSGKSTLLKLINGIIKPDSGKITIKGKIGALIELGAGFHPVLTGRENIYINAAILGMSKRQLDSCIDQIIDFSGISKYIDTPVRNYSSGMKVRLGFSIASHLDTDILLIDEVLAVGDRSFRMKCLNRISELKERMAIILVSHNMFNIAQICNKACVLDEGRILYNGHVNDAIDKYNMSQNVDEDKRITHLAEGLQINNFSMIRDEVTYNGDLELRIHLTSDRVISNTYHRITIMDASEEMIVAEWNSKLHGQFVNIEKGENIINPIMKGIKLRNGSYYLNYALTSDNGKAYLVGMFKACSFRVAGSIYTSSHYLV